MRQPHKVLGIRESATREEIEEARRRKLIYLNPDAFEKGTPGHESAVKEMYRVRQAYTAMVESLDRRMPVQLVSQYRSGQAVKMRYDVETIKSRNTRLQAFFLSCVVVVAVAVSYFFIAR